jgi:hypothetical protein
LKVAAASVCSLVCAWAFAGEPASGYRAYEFPQYTLITRDKTVAQELPSQAAQTEALLAKLLDRKPHVGGVPNFIVYLPRDTWVRYFDDGSNSFAAFVPDRFANYLLLSNREALEELELRYAVRHVYTHLFLHTQFEGVHPWWFDEGLANLVQRSDIRGTVARVGFPPAVTGGWMSIDQLMRFESRIVTCRTSGYFTGADYPAFFLVYRGLVSDPEFGAQMTEYLQQYSDLRPVDEALKSSFGKTGEELNRALYTQGQAGRVIRLEIPPLAPIPLPPARNLSDEEFTQLLANLMLLTEIKPARMQDMVDRLYQRAPDSTNALALRMRLAARAGDDPLLDRLQRMADPHTSDPGLARGAGLALFERLQTATPIAAAVRKRMQDYAFDYLDRAVMSRPDDPEAVWAHAMLAAELQRDLPIALRRVQNMSAILPMNADLTLALASLKGASGAPEEKIRLLHDALRYSRSLEQRRQLSLQLQAAKSAPGATKQNERARQ